MKPLPGNHLSGPSTKEVFEHAVGEGESLADAAVEMGVPSREVGKAAPHETGQEHGEGHLQRPVYPMPTTAAPVQNGRPPFKGLR